MVSVEIHVPISPRPSFFMMIHFFAASLRRRGGAFSKAKIIVSVGDDCEPFDIDDVHPELARYNISWRWADRTVFSAQDYFATGLSRWEDFESDYVIMADADTLVLGDISESLRWLKGSRSICGVIATFPPFMARSGRNTDGEQWPELFKLAGLVLPSFDAVYPGFEHFYNSEQGVRAAPPYYNYGFVLGTREAMGLIAKTIKDDCQAAARYMKTDLHAQAGLTLSIVRNRVSASYLPTRFNMWNWSPYASAFPEEFANVKLLHYLQSEIFDKARDLENLTILKDWLFRNEQSENPMARLLVGGFGAFVDEVAENCYWAGQSGFIDSS